MATIDTASPGVSTRPQNPPVGNDQTIAGELDLAQTPAWSFLSSFAFPAPDHFSFTYNDSDVTLDIGAGRVARQTDDGQTILTVDPVTGLNLKGGTVNYIYFTGSDTVESKDSDVPPGPNSLLIGTVDPRDGTINVETRGRSPVSQFQTDSGPVAGGASDESRTAVDGKDLADGEIAYHREFVPDGFVFRLNLFGVMDDTVTETAGLAARVVDANDGTVYATTESKRESLADPDKVFGPVDLRLEVRNDTGAAVTGASGRFEYDVVSGDPPGLAVDTLEATNITSDSVDLTGDLRSLGQAATADVRHEYREVGASTFTQTAIDTLSSPQEFTDAVSGLSSGTDYEFRALADGSDGSSDQGALVTFTTEGGQTLIIDDFEDGDKTTLASDWDGWNGDTGALTVTGGEGILTANDSRHRIRTKYDTQETLSTASIVVDGDSQAGDGGFQFAVEDSGSGENFIIAELNQDGTITTADGYTREINIGSWSVDTEYEFRVKNIDYVNWTFDLEVLEAGSQIHSDTYEFRAAVDAGDRIALNNAELSGTSVDYDTQIVRGSIDSGLTIPYIPPGSTDWYRMSKGSGTTVKNWRRTSAGIRYGTINGASWVSGNYTDGYALSGDGSDDFIDLHTMDDWAPELKTAWTVAFTIETTDTSSAFLGSTGGSPGFGIGMNRFQADSGEIRVLVQDNSSNTVFVTGNRPGAVNDGNKHRVVVVGETSDPSNWEIYIDTNEESVVVQDDGLSGSVGPFSENMYLLCRNNSGATQFTNGTMDNVIFSTDAWSSSQVSTDYNEQPWT
jgi:hypothetical protein